MLVVEEVASYQGLVGDSSFPDAEHLVVVVGSLSVFLLKLAWHLFRSMLAISLS